MGEDERANAGREEVLEWMGQARAARERPPRMNSVGFTPTRRAQPSRVGALTAEKRGDFSHARRSHGEAPASLPTNCGTADTMRVRFTRSTFVFTSVQLAEVCPRDHAWAPEGSAFQSSRGAHDWWECDPKSAVGWPWV